MGRSAAAHTRRVPIVPGPVAFVLATLATASLSSAVGGSPDSWSRPGDWPMFKGDAARRGEGVDGPIGDPVLRWRFQADGAVPGNVSVGADLVYASSDDGVLHALDLATGTERWRWTTDEPPLSGPTLDERSIYVFDGLGVLHALDRDTGTERWSASAPVAGPSSPTPRAVNGSRGHCTTLNALTLPAP